MAESLAILGAVDACVSLLGAVSRSIKKFKTVINAPKEFEEFSQEAAAIEAIRESLSNQHVRDSICFLGRDGQNRFEAIVTSCNKCATRIQLALAGFEGLKKNSEPKFKSLFSNTEARIRWATTMSQQLLRNEIALPIASLNNFIASLTHSHISRVGKALMLATPRGYAALAPPGTRAAVPWVVGDVISIREQGGISQDDLYGIEDELFRYAQKLLQEKKEPLTQIVLNSSRPNRRQEYDAWITERRPVRHRNKAKIQILADRPSHLPADVLVDLTLAVREQEDRDREELIKRAVRAPRQKEAQRAKVEKSIRKAANIKEQISKSSDPIEALNQLLGVELPRPNQLPSQTFHLTNPSTPTSSSRATSEDSGGSTQAKLEKILNYRRRRDDPANTRDEYERAKSKLAELQDADFDCDTCKDPLYERWWRCRNCEPSVRICRSCGGSDSRCPRYGHKMEKRVFED